MYDQFYGFSGRPFQLTPDPAFYFESGTHRKAMSYLGYGLAQGEGFIVITGDIGAGKTTLVGHLMATIDPRRLTAVQLVSTQVGGDDVLRLAAQNFGIASEGVDKATLLARVEAFLQDKARAGKRSLLIVDEAQNLSTAALEELRMLSNFQLGGQSLLQIFLLGQPEFREVISGEARLEQLRQRVIATHHLDPMQPQEVAPYIEHRLGLVGWTGNPRFTPDAYQMLAAASAGVPRRLNALVSRVLLLGAIDRLDIIDRRVIEAVLADSGSMEAEPVAVPAFESVAVAVAVSEPVVAVEPVVRDVEAPVAVVETEQDSEPERDVASEAVAALDTPVEDEELVLDVSTVRDEPVAETISADELHAIRAEVRALNAALADVQAGVQAGGALVPARIELIEARLAAVEQRAQEQDEVLRRILAKLIEWAERDERNGPFAHRAA
ncbi:XrtA-associated ATPase [Sphingobium sufflavum]|uniref:XrtA/PEP-CTERM system-associated ATPase n=1 Tax=Sphingobium sufflavum TaxID=1129547 RepID=UPI001F490676|nr:XrtA/PEP-CTERM system-associated ATPase [Sphingobium sufflavum]MCE7797383.1 XrtA-associated ATPase [Sphingobium sufflavum]